MNEEELKKEINVGISYTNPNRVWKAIGDLEDLSFQKGKLEQKKEDNNILIKYSKLRLYRSKSCQLLIKQLQKEFGKEAIEKDGAITFIVGFFNLTEEDLK